MASQDIDDSHLILDLQVRINGQAKYLLGKSTGDRQFIGRRRRQVIVHRKRANEGIEITSAVDILCFQRLVERIPTQRKTAVNKDRIIGVIPFKSVCSIKERYAGNILQRLTVTL